MALQYQALSAVKHSRSQGLCVGIVSCSPCLQVAAGVGHWHVLWHMKRNSRHHRALAADCLRSTVEAQRRYTSTTSPAHPGTPAGPLWLTQSPTL